MKPENVENAQNYPTIHRDGKTWAPAEFAGKMQLAILRVRMLHVAIPAVLSEPVEHCHHCKTEYPCLTIQALDGKK